MKIGLLTCQEHKDLIEDDLPLKQALEKEGHCGIPVVWNEGKLFDGPLIIRTPWDYALDAHKFFSLLEKQSKSHLLLNSLEVVRWNLSKSYQVELQELGAPVVPTLLFEKGNQVPAIREFHELPWEKLVIKPEIGAGGYQTIVVDRDEVGGFGDIIESIYSRCGVLVQPYCESITDFGEVSYLYFKSKGKEAQFSHCLLKKAKAGEFRVQDDHGGTVHAVEFDEAFHQCALENLKRIPFDDWLYARVDMLYYKDKPVVGEIEMIEPELFFRMGENGARNFVQALKTYL